MVRLRMSACVIRVLWVLEHSTAPLKCFGSQSESKEKKVHPLIQTQM